MFFNIWIYDKYKIPVMMRTEANSGDSGAAKYNDPEMIVVATNGNDCRSKIQRLTSL